MTILIAICSIGLLSALLVLRADARRRRVRLTSLSHLPLLSLLDLLWPALLIGAAVATLIAAARSGVVPLFSPLTWFCVAAAAIAVFVWGEGRHQVQFQRPAGIVTGEALVLLGIYLLVQFAVFRGNALSLRGLPTWALVGVSIVSGGILLAVVVPRFLKGFERHRIIERIDAQGESVQPEYLPPTHECPHPERWKMMDAQTAEMEILDFLKSVVLTMKPELILETGTFIGHSAIKMAEGLKENGFGKIVTVEYDPVVFAKAQERINASSVRDWMECRNQSSMDTEVDGTIDLFFSDSHLPIREAEIRKFLPQINSQGLILVHDASSHFQVVREALLKLEAEGLISTVLLSTPRGMAVAQKRDGRK